MSQPAPPPPSAQQPAAPPSPTAGPAPSKTRALPFVLAAAVVVLALGVAAVVFLIGRGHEKAGAPVGAMDIGTPATLDGRPQMTEPFFTDTVKSMQAGLAKATGATTSVGAMYGAVAQEKQVLLVLAVKLPVRDQATALSQALAQAKVREIAPVPAGPLGGVASCGMQNALMAACGWADAGSVGVIFWNGQPESTAEAEFLKLRAEIEHRS
jgi:hypothetical protein